MWKKYNANPGGRQVGDCTVRAISAALCVPWDDVYVGLCVKGMELRDMPSSNAVWGAFLRSKGYERKIMPDRCPDCYTVADFAEEHPDGTFILALSGHVVCVRNGDWFDTWDSGGELPLYYWMEV